VGGALLTVATAFAPGAAASDASKVADVAGAGQKVAEVTTATQQAVKLNFVSQVENDITYSIQTSKGPILVSAQIAKNGSQLQLNNVGVFSEMGPALNIGAKEMMKVRNVIAENAKAQGFKELRITGQRVGGANSGKSVDLTIDLTK